VTPEATIDISGTALEHAVNWDAEVEVASNIASSLNYGGTHNCWPQKVDIMP
jgi:hypothetical protein